MSANNSRVLRLGVPGLRPPRLSPFCDPLGIFAFYRYLIGLHILYIYTVLYMKVKCSYTRINRQATPGHRSRSDSAHHRYFDIDAYFQANYRLSPRRTFAGISPALLCIVVQNATGATTRFTIKTNVTF